MQHLTLKHVLGAASSQIWEYLPIDRRGVSWSDVVEAAYRRRRDLGVSQRSWGDACGQMGRVGAAVCVLVTDRATQRTVNPVREPAAYFRGMLRKYHRGELRLNRSVVGLLEAAAHDAVASSDHAPEQPRAVPALAGRGEATWG